MAILLSDVEAVLVDIYGGFMSESGMFTGTDLPASTPNPSLRSPIATAGRDVGLVMVNPLVMTDADLAALPAANLSKFLDMAKLRLVEACLGNYRKIDTNIDGGYEQHPDQLRKAMMAEVGRLQAQVKLVYGIGLATLSVASLDLDFQESNDPLSPNLYS